MSQILCIETSFYAARVVVIHLPAPCARFRGGRHIADVLRTRHKRDNVTTGFLPSVPLHHLQELSKPENTADRETPPKLTHYDQCSNTTALRLIHSRPGPVRCSECLAQVRYVAAAGRSGSASNGIQREALVFPKRCSPYCRPIRLKLGA